MIGEIQEIYRKNYICLKNKQDITLYSNFLNDDMRQLMFYVAACDPKKRSTCKSRQEIATWLDNNLFNVMTLQSIVVEDQFSSIESQKSRFKGDESSYFPIQYTSR